MHAVDTAWLGPYNFLNGCCGSNPKFLIYRIQHTTSKYTNTAYQQSKPNADRTSRHISQNARHEVRTHSKKAAWLNKITLACLNERRNVSRPRVYIRISHHKFITFCVFHCPPIHRCHARHPGRPSPVQSTRRNWLNKTHS